MRKRQRRSSGIPLPRAVGLSHIGDSRANGDAVEDKDLGQPYGPKGGKVRGHEGVEVVIVNRPQKVGEKVPLVKGVGEGGGRGDERGRPEQRDRVKEGSGCHDVACKRVFRGGRMVVAQNCVSIVAWLQLVHIGNRDNGRSRIYVGHEDSWL